jgi:hypothetical protein
MFGQCLSAEELARRKQLEREAHAVRWEILLARIMKAKRRFYSTYGVTPEEVWLGLFERSTLTAEVEYQKNENRFTREAVRSGLPQIFGLNVRESGASGVWVGLSSRPQDEEPEELGEG